MTVTPIPRFAGVVESVELPGPAVQALTLAAQAAQAGDYVAELLADPAAAAVLGAVELDRARAEVDARRSAAAAILRSAVAMVDDALGSACTGTVGGLPTVVRTRDGGLAVLGLGTVPA